MYLCSERLTNQILLSSTLTTIHRFACEICVQTLSQSAVIAIHAYADNLSLATARESLYQGLHFTLNEA